MVPRTSFPPREHHTTQQLEPAAAQSHLAAFLTQAATQPYLHPDSYLSTSGIRFSATAGPTGGLAIHHLKRIEAGLRGENLTKESAEDLAKFDSHDGIAQDDGRGYGMPESDDRRLDVAISRSSTAVGSPKPDSSRKRKRIQEISDWAENSSQADAPPDTPTTPQRQELESFANTPLRPQSPYPGGQDIDNDPDWQDKQDYEQQQTPWFGDVDPLEREAAPVVQQNGIKPGVDVEEKRARKEAKKARKEEERRRKAAKTGDG